jgi:hypothetical protein
MNDIIYLEADAEITSVIDKIRKSQNNAIILVLPRGSGIAQSIINLKLLMRSAKQNGKAIALVSSDRIAHNLANQLKINVFSKVSEAEKAEIALPEEVTKSADAESGFEKRGLKVNTYQRYSLANLNEKAKDGFDDKDEEDEKPTTPDDEEPRFQKRSLQTENSDEENNTKGRESKIKVEQDEDNDNIGKIKIERRSTIKKTTLKKKIIIIAVVAAFILVAAASAYFAPKATATVNLATHNFDETLNIIVERDVQPADGVLTVQGQILDLEKESTKTFPTTGKKNVGEKAKGTITISNSTNPNAVKLVAGTKATSNGKVFLLDSDVTVPALKVTSNCSVVNGKAVCEIEAGQANAAVTASENGDSYNIAPATFVVGSYSAISKTAFTGGTNKEVNVMTDDDLKTAGESLNAEMLASAKTELTDLATKQNVKILESQVSSEVVSQEASKKAGDEGDAFDLKLKLKFFVMSFTESDIKKTVIDGVQSKIGSDEMIVNAESSDITYKVLDNDINDAQMKLEATFNGKIGKKVDSTQIQNNIKNKSLGSAKNYIQSINGVESASVKMWPNFWPRTPFTLKRITVKFDYSK